MDVLALIVAWGMGLGLLIGAVGGWIGIAFAFWNERRWSERFSLPSRPWPSLRWRTPRLKKQA